ncbi:MAG: AfsA-related hotdog domain-containing protein [Cellvibrionales bacterium]|nr:AfsA-related hotdog domain-containing protein [Cellvibrionales bacterium]
MTGNTYIIIGNDYESFSDNVNILTSTEMFVRMNKQHDWPRKIDSIHFGQGVNTHDREILTKELLNRNVDVATQFESPPLELTHKVSDENVLISAPEKLEDHHYRFDLIITDKVDRLSDHVTGKHVGAMLLMEAARQATIVALESNYPDESYGLTVRHFDSSFSHFLFPLPSNLDVKILEKESDNDKYFDVIVETYFYQGGINVSKVVLDLCLSKKQDLRLLEGKKANQSINGYFDYTLYRSSQPKVAV